MRRVVDGGRIVALEAHARVGQGGEGEVYRVAPGRAVKVFFDPMSARKREKIERFPRGLPAQVVRPEAIVLDTDGQPAGYAMRLVEGAEDAGVLLSRRGRDGKLSSGWVAAFFVRVARVVRELHAAGVIVGDVNPGNLIFVAAREAAGDAREIALIDAESMQYAGFPCEVAHERYVDPALYGHDLAAGGFFSPETDHYALAVLLFSSLLYVHPYGGVHPAYATLLARAQARVSVLRAGVKRPVVASPPRVLPDALLHWFHGIFEEGRRDPLPEVVLGAVTFTRCTCGVEHARAACPVCTAHAQVPAMIGHMKGAVRSAIVFSTAGTILEARVVSGAIRVVHRTPDGLLREDGSRVEDEARPLALPGEETFTSDDGVLRRRQAGTLVGRVLAGQTWFRAGAALGLGFYRPGRMAVFFVFDVARGPLRDVDGMPALRGKVTHAECVFDDEHALFVATCEEAGREHLVAALVDARGRVLAIEEARVADEASPWVGAGRPAVSRGQVVLSTKSGLVVLSPDPSTRRFEARRTFDVGDLGVVDLHAGPRGSLFAVTPTEVRSLTPT